MSAMEVQDSSVLAFQVCRWLPGWLVMSPFNQVVEAIFIVTV